MNAKIKPVLITTALFLALLAGPLFAGTFTLPKYEKFQLKNGLTVYLMEQHEVPLVSVSMVFPAGAVKDGQKSGLASFTADALLFGTQKYTKKQIEEELGYLGANYGTYAGLESAVLTMGFVNTDQDRVFPFLQEIVTSPTFGQGEFDKMKKRTLLQLEQKREQPRSVIGSYFNKFLFGNHVYGNPAGGTRPAVSKLTVADLKAFYKANYKPSESAISVVGDFNTAQMKKKITKLFAGWNAEGASAAVAPGPRPAHTKSRLLLVNKDDANETSFMIGRFGIKRSNPDYVAIQVINTILGGRFTSWLNDELRVNQGLTYGASSRFAANKEPGTFYISSFTRTKFTVKAIDLALDVYDRLHSKGIDKETLSSAKNYIKGQYPPRYERGRSLAGLLTSMYIYGYDESFINNFQANVDSLTVAKAKEIVKKYFSKDNLQFVLIGKASEIRDKVKKYGLLVEKEIKAEGF